jgi:hypothetical protein
MVVKPLANVRAGLETRPEERLVDEDWLKSPLIRRFFPSRGIRYNNFLY